MFTGIIQDISEVKEVQNTEGKGLFLILSTHFDLTKTSPGASIACNGCCLTVVDKGKHWFAVDVSVETLSKTTLGSWIPGNAVNLEKAMQAGDEFGGHMVSGHIDGTAEVSMIRAEGDSHRVRFKVPEDLIPYLAPKGSIAVDGVSLTVNEVIGDQFGVNIIPHTWLKTIFDEYKPGDRVNIEVDMMARYVRRYMDHFLSEPPRTGRHKK